MKRNISKKFVIPVVACIAIIFFLCYYFFFTPLLNKDGNYYLYIDSDDTIDSVYAKLDSFLETTVHFANIQIIFL